MLTIEETNRRERGPADTVAAAVKRRRHGWKSPHARLGQGVGAMKVGPALRKLRRDRKVMLQLVARRLRKTSEIGIDQLRSWETGREEPNREEIGLVLEALDVGYDDLARALARMAQEDLREQNLRSRTDLKEAIASFSGKLAEIEAAYDEKVTSLYTALDELEASLRK